MLCIGHTFTHHIQSHIEFSNFITNLESTSQATTLKKPFLAIVLGDFHAKKMPWFDQDNTSYKGSILHDLMAQYGLIQIIHEPRHILESSISCTDLVFTSQENLVVNSRVHSSLYPNYRHQIAFCNFNLKIYYPLPYEGLIWKYEKANADLIKRAIRDFDWENKLSFIGINDQVALFNEIIVNIMSNFFPNKIMIFDDRDPPWINKNIKYLITYKNAIYKKLIHHNDNHLKLDLLYSQDSLHTEIEQAKRKYFEKLINKSYLIIDQFPLFQFMVRYLNVSYIIQCTNI